MSVAIFRDYDQAALDRQYDNGLKVGPEWLQGQRARWAEQSARARDTLHCTLDVPFDTASGERLDIFRPKQASGGARRRRIPPPAQRSCGGLAARHTVPRGADHPRH